MDEDLKDYQYYIASPYMADVLKSDASARNSFLNQIQSLPKSISTFLISASTAESIFKLAKQYELRDSQVSKLALAIRDLVVGNTFLKDFPGLLSASLRINSDQATSLTNNLLAILMTSIIEDFKIIQRQKFASRLAPSPQLNLRSQPVVPQPASPPKPQPIQPLPSQQPWRQPQPTPQQPIAPNLRFQPTPPPVPAQPKQTWQGNDSFQMPPKVVPGSSTTPPGPGPSQSNNVINLRDKQGL